MPGSTAWTKNRMEGGTDGTHRFHPSRWLPRELA
jgi:hypothetical protein